MSDLWPAPAAGEALSVLQGDEMTIQFNIPEKRVQCQFCGRVRIGGEWTHSEIVADVVGQCPTCMDYQLKRARLKRERAARDLERRAAKGQLRHTGPADVFQGFREET